MIEVDRDTYCVPFYLTSYNMCAIMEYIMTVVIETEMTIGAKQPVIERGTTHHAIACTFTTKRKLDTYGNGV